MVRGTGKHSTSKSSFSCKKDSSDKEPLQYSYHQLENMFLFVLQHLWAPNAVTLSSFPFVPDLAVTFFIYSTCCCVTTVGLCSVFYSVSSHPAGKFLFYFIFSYQKLPRYLRYKARWKVPYSLRSSKRCGWCCVFQLFSPYILIILPLAFFQKRLINKMPLFHFFLYPKWS